MKEKMSKILDQVVNLLTEYPSLRDSDDRLTATIWYQYTKNVKEIDAMTLLRRFAAGELPSYESISRCRRKVQEEKPKLRGQLWEKRHNKKAQNSVKSEIKNIGATLNG